MNDSLLILWRVFCAGGLLLTGLAYYYVSKNYERLFGADPNVPSENSGSSTYSRTQIYAVLIHLAAFLIMGLFLLH